jgi:hypothetical protein
MSIYSSTEPGLVPFRDTATKVVLGAIIGMGTGFIGGMFLAAHEAKDNSRPAIIEKTNQPSPPNRTISKSKGQLDNPSGPK